MINIVVVVTLLISLAALAFSLDAWHRTGADGSSGPPRAGMVAPATGSTLHGTVDLDALTTGSNVTSLEFLLTGGTLHGVTIANGKGSLIGWVAEWNTTTVPNGTYVITATAQNSAGAGTSAGVSVTVQN
jgi:hypothetical protein